MRLQKRRKKTEFHEIGNVNIDYYYIRSDGLVDSDDYCDDETCSNLSAFKTREFAEKIAFKQLMERKLLKFSLEHDGDKIDWNDIGQEKIDLYYNPVKMGIDIDVCVNFKQQGTIYFYSEEIARAAIDEFHDDLIKYFHLDFSK